MIEFAFVMVINLMPEPFSEWEYVGNFRSCQEAVLYVNLHYPDPNEVEMETRLTGTLYHLRILPSFPWLLLCSHVSR